MNEVLFSNTYACVRVRATVDFIHMKEERVCWFSHSGVIFSMHTQTISRRQKSAERKRWKNQKPNIVEEVDADDKNDGDEGEKMLIYTYYSLCSIISYYWNKIQFHSYGVAIERVYVRARCHSKTTEPKKWEKNWNERIFLIFHIFNISCDDCIQQHSILCARVSANTYDAEREQRVPNSMPYFIIAGIKRDVFQTVVPPFSPSSSSPSTPCSYNVIFPVDPVSRRWSFIFFSADLKNSFTIHFKRFESIQIQPQWFRLY